MSKNISIDKLNNHLFESIEMLKNSKDPNASENEKLDIPTAKAIADLAKVVVEGYKVKAQVMNMMSKGDNPKALRQASLESGILSEGDDKLIDN